MFDFNKWQLENSFGKAGAGGVNPNPITPKPIGNTGGGNPYFENSVSNSVAGGKPEAQQIQALPSATPVNSVAGSK